MLVRDEGTAATEVRPSSLDLPPDSVAFGPEQTLNTQAGKAEVAPDLRGLTRAARRGDADAFARIYDLYSFRLYKFLLVLARGDERSAREVCQAVFIKLARRLRVFDDERRLWAWMRVLAKNAFVDHCRARQRLNRFVALDELAAEPDAQAGSEHRLTEMLREALAGLPPDERELVQAAYVDARPLQELADETGQTYKSVESRLGRLRKKLKEQLLKNLRHENES